MVGRDCLDGEMKERGKQDGLYTGRGAPGSQEVNLTFVPQIYSNIILLGYDCVLLAICKYIVYFLLGYDCTILATQTSNARKFENLGAGLSSRPRRRRWYWKRGTRALLIVAHDASKGRFDCHHDSLRMFTLATITTAMSRSSLAL